MRRWNKMKNKKCIDHLNLIIKDARKMLTNAPNVDDVQNTAIRMAEGFLYCNIVVNLKENLARNTPKELGISKDELEKVEKEFQNLFQKSEEMLEDGMDHGNFDIKTYQEFKKKLKVISKNTYELLLEVEDIIDIKTCELAVSNFKKEAKKLGKELKIEQLDENEGLGISIGFK